MATAVHDERTVEEVTRVLERQARKGVPISYSDLCGLVPSAALDPYSTLLWSLLDRVSRASDARNGTMLSVLVVHKDGDARPGGGFFELAAKLGRQVRDKDECWVEEMKRVLDAYAR